MTRILAVCLLLAGAVMAQEKAPDIHRASGVYQTAKGAQFTINTWLGYIKNGNDIECMLDLNGDATTGGIRWTAPTTEKEQFSFYEKGGKWTIDVAGKNGGAAFTKIGDVPQPKGGMLAKLQATWSGNDGVSVTFDNVKHEMKVIRSSSMGANFQHVYRFVVTRDDPGVLQYQANNGEFFQATFTNDGLNISALGNYDVIFPSKMSGSAYGVTVTARPEAPMIFVSIANASGRTLTFNPMIDKLTVAGNGRSFPVDFLGLNSPMMSRHMVAQYPQTILSGTEVSVSGGLAVEASPVSNAAMSFPMLGLNIPLAWEQIRTLSLKK